ncbi:PAM68 family protein [Myxacorys almedinensis]|uniref:DUF3464 family protein n=1 Tax=Myxacorys almedinensis A TaxID=2690445 RepID=A0A8J7Z7Y3_9CYAN|nr:PAM68 family protein [Myxacorys almedinensis]NDJ19586.1 DUF3464 family protein [Myxacorys almedinensis A]
MSSEPKASESDDLQGQDPPGSASPSSRDRLPFEPTRKKDASPAKPPAIGGARNSAKPAASAPRKERPAPRKEGLQIPDVVSRRMAGRMAFFCGIPTSLGMLTFVVSYFIVTKGLFKLPNSAVLLVSLGFFGLGVIGLSYGFLSASWDEEHPGSLLGAKEFSTNLGRLTDAWKAARNEKTQD